MTTLRTGLHTGPTLWLLRGLLWLTAFSLAWLQVSPVYAANHAVVRDSARRAAWVRAHTPRVALPPGQTQTPDAALRARIVAKQAAAVKPVADVRPLSEGEMQGARGRGALRNPYFNGTLPWQRSFRDVNLCNGNLFKSFTDMQIAPARGAGLVLQRTYNSNDARIGPFGVGWTHAYDIRIQEASDVQTKSGNANDVPRTDFFGAKHTYHRDADGLYSPPAYMYDEMRSNYGDFLVSGPTRAQVMDDTEKGEDGTIKHYTNVLTLADGTSGNERACDYIQDRHGNTTNLTYALSYVQPGGATRKLLTQVIDPSGRALVFTWSNLGTVSQPAYRITQVQGPLVGGATVPGVTYLVTYSYYTNAASPNAANELFNLKSVTLDTGGLARTTSYTYTSFSYTYTDQNNQQQTLTENGLLASVTDPLSHTVSYGYAMAAIGLTGTVWVNTITEPAGVDAGNNPRTFTWTISYVGGTGNLDQGGLTQMRISNSIATDYVTWNVDTSLRIAEVAPDQPDVSGYYCDLYYDGDNNVVQHDGLVGADQYTYGPHGNVLTHRAVSQNQGRNNPLSSDSFFPGTDTTTYYNASQYFQKAGATDMNGHATAMGVGTSTDASVGNRGEVLWVQDAGYNDSTSPSYHKQFSYTYNQYGQKLTETNLNGVVTQYTYGDTWGNLTQVVQDPGTGHLNRTTAMTYDAAGRVLTSTDPLGQISTFTYNKLGQPLTFATPAKTSVSSAETITYVYDGNGRTHSVQDNRGTTVMAYEAGCDRVSSVTDPVTGTTSYTYLTTGERETVGLPGGGTWTYSYLTFSPYYNRTGLFTALSSDDPNSIHLNLGTITDDQGRIVILDMKRNGQLRSVRTNQPYTQSAALVSYAQTDYTYDGTPGTAPGNGNMSSHGWLTQISTTWHYYDSSGGSPMWHARLLSQNAYTYDNAGQRLSNTAVAAAGAGGAPQYAGGTPTYDGSGNVTNQITTARTEKYQTAGGSSGYDALNRLTRVDYGDGQTQSYTFDAMGNRTQRQDSASGTTNSTFDAANRLTGTTGAEASPYTNDLDGNTLTGAGRTNTWDSQNRLVSCLTDGSTTVRKLAAKASVHQQHGSIPTAGCGKIERCQPNLLLFAPFLALAPRGQSPSRTFSCLSPRRKASWHSRTCTAKDSV